MAEDVFTKDRPLIEQLHGWFPGAVILIPQSLFDHLESSGYDMRDISVTPKVPLHG